MDVGTTGMAKKNCSSIDLFDGSNKGREIAFTLVKLKCSIHLAALDVCTLNEIGQQTALAFETLKKYVCLAFETDIQYPTSVTTLRNPNKAFVLSRVLLVR